MATEKQVKISYKCWAIYGEAYPWFYLNDFPEDGGIEIFLTKEEVAEYKRVTAEYDKWQTIIQERAFPNFYESRDACH